MRRTIDAERDMTVVMQVTQKFPFKRRKPKLDCGMISVAFRAMPKPRRRPPAAKRIPLLLIH
jgi:hypothetical protein